MRAEAPNAELKARLASLQNELARITAADRPPQPVPAVVQREINLLQLCGWTEEPEAALVAAIQREAQARRERDARQAAQQPSADVVPLHC